VRTRAEERTRVAAARPAAAAFRDGGGSLGRDCRPRRSSHPVGPHVHGPIDAGPMITRIRLATPLQITVLTVPWLGVLVFIDAWKNPPPPAARPGPVPLGL